MSETLLSQTVKAERAARGAVEEARQYGLPADALNRRLNTLTGARAATDEAVRKVEGVVEAVGDFLDCRDSGGYQAEGQAVDALRAALVATLATPAPTAQGESTGGATT